MGMKKRVVPKLNWSCPSDAKWQMPDNTVRIGSVTKVTGFPDRMVFRIE